MGVRASMHVPHFNVSRFPGIAVWWTIRQGFSGVKVLFVECLIRGVYSRWHEESAHMPLPGEIAPGKVFGMTLGCHISPHIRRPFEDYSLAERYRSPARKATNLRSRGLPPPSNFRVVETYSSICQSASVFPLCNCRGTAPRRVSADRLSVNRCLLSIGLV
jgi:hypothetical protein